MRIPYRQLQHEGFVVDHDEASGIIHIHLDRSDTGFPLGAMANDIQENFSLTDRARDTVYDKIVSAVELEVILKAIE